MILKIAFKQAPGTMLLGHCNKILFSECKVQVKDQQTKGKIMLQKKKIQQNLNMQWKRGTINITQLYSSWKINAI